MTKINPNAKSKRDRNSLLDSQAKEDRRSTTDLTKKLKKAKERASAPVGGKNRNREYSLLTEENKPHLTEEETASSLKQEELPAVKIVLKQKLERQKKTESPRPKSAAASDEVSDLKKMLEKNADPVFPERKKQKPAASDPKKNKVPLLIVLAVVACLAAVYIGGIFYWKGEFLPGTFINDQEVSQMEAPEAEYALLPQNTNFEITELARQESIPLANFDYTLTFDVPLETLIANQNYYLWPFSVFKETRYDNAVSISYDKARLKEALLSLDAFKEDVYIKPQDAFLSKKENGHYEIVPEISGDQLDEKKALSYVEQAIEGGNFSLDLTKTDSYLVPAVFRDNSELIEQLKFVQAIGEETITIDLTGAEEVLDSLALRDFVSLDENEEMIINEDYLWNYVTELSNKYNTYLNKREFTTHSGNVVTVGGNRTEDYGIDTYGFLMNRTSTVNILRGCILSKTDQVMTPAWDVPALTRDDVNGDIGTTYIEISLNEQHLWYYIDGQLFYETDVVTGLDTDQRRTPWGVFRAYEKDKDCTLKGEMAGDRWNTHVDYWISVTWTGCGIHDATWQPSFGGDRYKYGGSHGCINVSLDAAKTLYENVKVDTPIIIY